MVVRVADKCGGDVGHVFSLFIIVFTMRLSDHETIDLDVHLVHLFQLFQLLYFFFCHGTTYQIGLLSWNFL